MKTPPLVSGLIKAANSFGTKVDNATNRIARHIDHMASKHPLLAAVGGLAYMLLGTVAVTANPTLAVPLLPALLLGAAFAGRGLHHLFTKPQQLAYIRLDQENSALSR